jgi:hypothetical protein
LSARSISGNHVFSASVIPIADSSGISQSALLVLARQTTDATPTARLIDSSKDLEVCFPHNAI